MSKIITIKLTQASPKIGPFNIYDTYGNLIAENVPKCALIEGVSYSVADNVSMIKIDSVGSCKSEKTKDISAITQSELNNSQFVETSTACLWRHLTNVNSVYNNYYGTIYPYIIEYPLSFQYYDEIVQSVKDYSKVYQYVLDGTGVFNYNDKIELNDAWFNNAVIYNGQQSSGILTLVPKPRNNLQAYITYPLYNSDSKTITFTKSDNFYQYNTFFNVVKDRTIPLFITGCESLSIDKLVNQSNMDYSYRSFHKDPLRAKDTKVRHILNNRSDINIVSQFIYISTMLSYK